MYRPYPGKRPSRRVRSTQALMWVLGLGLWLTLSTWGCQCGAPNNTQIYFSAPEPAQRFIKNIVPISLQVSPSNQVKRFMLAIRYQGQTRIYKTLERTDKSKIELDWDTTKEKDGPYLLEAEALLNDDTVITKKLGPFWVVNRLAQMRIKECKNGPLIARNAQQVNMQWENAPEDFPTTNVEMFVQGKSVGVRIVPPFTFDLDLSKFPHGTEVNLSAIATKGIYRGSTAICSVFIDRKGPTIQMIYPEASTKIVPRKFRAVLQVEEEFGIQEVRLLVGEKVVGRTNSPPYQVLVDLKGYAHNSTVTLKAIATDRAGNITAKPPSRTFKIDAKPPVVQLIAPSSSTPHLGDIKYLAKVTDEAGVASVNFYLEDKPGQRVDNILNTTPKDNGSEIYEANTKTAMSLYGAGTRYFVVDARDIHQNRTVVRRAFLIGCRELRDCPTPSAPYRCLGNRCIIPRKLGDRCNLPQSCEPPLVCFKGGQVWCDAQPLGICRQPCNKGQCAKGYFCRSIGNQSACFPSDACSPFSVNCTDSQQCVPWGKSSFVCLPTANKQANARCVPYSCGRGGGCARGWGCVPISGQTGSCRKLCDMDIPYRDCRSGACVPFPLQDRSRNSMGYCK